MRTNALSSRQRAVPPCAPSDRRRRERRPMRRPAGGRAAAPHRGPREAAIRPVQVRAGFSDEPVCQVVPLLDLDFDVVEFHDVTEMMLSQTLTTQQEEWAE